MDKGTGRVARQEGPGVAPLVEDDLAGRVVTVPAEWLDGLRLGGGVADRVEGLRRQVARLEEGIAIAVDVLASVSEVSS